MFPRVLDHTLRSILNEVIKKQQGLQERGRWGREVLKHLQECSLSSACHCYESYLVYVTPVLLPHAFPQCLHKLVEVVAAFRTKNECHIIDINEAASTSFQINGLLAKKDC
jgi:hypothetical protein